MANTWGVFHSWRFNVDERLADQRRVVDVIVKFFYDAVEAARDRHWCFVTLNLTDAVELCHFVTNADEPITWIEI